MTRDRRCVNAKAWSKSPAHFCRQIPISLNMAAVAAAATNAGVDVACPGEPADAARDRVWYFAIGAMIHPAAIRVRGVEPAASVAAVLVGGFERRFLAPRGMATLVRLPEDQGQGRVAGVAHYITRDELAKLDAIEVGYERQDVAADLVGNPGSKLTCTCYFMGSRRLAQEGRQQAPPQERYQELIVRGLRCVGSDSDDVAALAARVASPRPTSSAKFPVGSSSGEFTLDTLWSLRNDPNPPFVVNGKVLRHGSPETVDGTLWMQRVRQSYAGKDITLRIARVYTELRLHPVYDEHDLSPEICTFVEDILCRGILSGWTVVGHLVAGKVNRPSGNRETAAADTAGAANSGITASSANEAIYIHGAHNRNDGVLALVARMRCEAAFRYWRELRRTTGACVPVYVSAGFGAHFNCTERPHGEWCAEYLRELGLPQKSLVLDSRLLAARNTCEEAIAWASILEDRRDAGPFRVMCFTAAFHVARAEYLMRRVFAAFPGCECAYAHHKACDPPLISPHHGKNDIPRAGTAASLRGGEEEEQVELHYTDKSFDFIPLECWSYMRRDAIYAFEQASFNKLRSAPYGAWLDWMQAHPPVDT